MLRFYRLNQNINAPQLRVLDKEGKQVGVLKKEEALAKARELGVDLVEIGPQAKPPVVKLIDFKKFRYEESKKERLSKRNTKESQTKEVWLGPLISEHDLNTRLNRAKEFLQEKNRVKFTVKFSGREMAHTELGFQVLTKVEENLKEFGTIDGKPRLMGRNLSVSFNPIKKGQNESKDTKDSIKKI